jgi:hypothetical protein
VFPEAFIGGVENSSKEARLYNISGSGQQQFPSEGGEFRASRRARLGVRAVIGSPRAAAAKMPRACRFRGVYPGFVGTPAPCPEGPRPCPAPSLLSNWPRSAMS